MCLTDECYQRSCVDTKTAIFLIAVCVIVLGLLGFSIYLVAKPVVCINESTVREPEYRLFKKYYKKQPVCSETSIQTYPHIAALIEKGAETHICSGAIISKNWMLTAAHCLILCQQACTNYVIRAGSSHTNRGGKLYTIIQYEIHPNFNFTTLENDLGLIKANEFDGIKVAKISSLSLQPHGYAQLLGWAPYSKIDVAYRDNGLKSINLTIQHHLVCRYRMKGERSRFSLTDRMLCGTYSTKGGGCYTDAGGPLFQKDVVIGIAMFGQVCFSCDYHISILTDVSYYHSFINNLIGV